MRPRQSPLLALMPGALLLALLIMLDGTAGWAVTGDDPSRYTPQSSMALSADPDLDARALIRLTPAAPDLPGQPPPRDWYGYGARAAVAALGLPLLLWIVRRPRTVNTISGPGFEVISPTEKRRLIPLEERFQALDFVSRIDTAGQLRLSANLNRVTLSIRRYGYLMEDKNYRNALLVNRRRVRRTLLRDGDVLDLGDLTLLYRDNRTAKIVRYSSITPPEGKTQLKFERTKGPVRRGMPMLTPDQTANRVFYVTKNKVFIGRSENNDLVIKARNVYYRHAKIERVGGRWKLQDLSVLGNTYVNNRRVEQRFLKDGDEIAIETHRFRFGFVTRTMRDRPPQPYDAGDGAADPTGDPGGDDGIPAEDRDDGRGGYAGESRNDPGGAGEGDDRTDYGRGS